MKLHSSSISVHHIGKGKVFLASVHLVSLHCKMNYIRYLLSLFELLVALSLLVYCVYMHRYL